MILSFNLILVLLYMYIYFFSFTLLQELISINFFNIYNIVFTLKAQHDLNCVESAVKL